MFPLSSCRLPRPSLTTLRAHLSAVLALVMLLVPLVVRTSGQSGPRVAKVPQSDHFVFYRGPNGEFSCREATVFEARELEQIRPQGLQRITHVNETSLKAENATVENVENLTIILRGTTNLNSNIPARDAFRRAADIWQAQIKSPITVYIDVDFGPDNFGQPWGSGTIGATSSPAFTTAYDTVRSQLIAGASTTPETSLYTSLPTGSLPTNQGNSNSITVSQTIGRAIGFLPANAPNPDTGDTTPRPRIGFNSADFSFDFNPNDGSDGPNGDGIDAGKIDFEAVAVHEIGHALGFTSRAGRTTPANPAIWDIFRFRSGTTLGTFDTAQRIMTADGLQYYFSGGAHLGLSTGGSDGEAPGGDGRQSSHWKDDQIPGNSYIGIMDPTISSGSRKQITANDTIALNFFGYNLNNNNPPPPPPPPPPTPANNVFANAQVISGCSGTVNGSNVAATKESGEPSHSPDGDTGGGSVWYHWQAPSSGSVTINTQGSTYDTLLAVYTGNSVTGLTTIGKNDDVDLGNILHSQVVFNATAGTIYKIAVDGWGGETGSVTLNWSESGCTQSSNIQLGHLRYSAAEANGSVQVFFTRSDGSGADSVDYATSDPAGLAECTVKNGVASSRCDYATSIGTVRFASGERLKSVFIPLVNDSYAEGTESFAISISNPTGASLGPITSVTIAVQDNESSNGANPLDTAAFFVEQHYIDFLGRNPEPSGKTAWMNILNGCPSSGIDGNGNHCDRIEVSAGFFRSPEFQARGYFIYRFYSAVGSIPVYEQFTPDFGRVSGFLSDAQLEANKVTFVNDFMNRTAFQNKYATTFGNPTAYVDALLHTVGLPSHPSRTTWINQLNASNTSATRGQVLRALVESPQVYDKYYTEAFVIMQYFGYLRRTADGSYVNWINTMNQTGGDYRTMINGFMNSAEYRKRFGP